MRSLDQSNATHHAFLSGLTTVIGRSATTVLDADRSAELYLTHFGRCSIARILCPPARVEPLYAVRRGSTADSIRFLLQRKGQTKFVQDECVESVCTESLLIYDPSRECQFNSASSTDHVVLLVPRESFDLGARASFQRPHLFCGPLAGLPKIVASIIQAYCSEGHLLNECSRNRLEKTLVTVVKDLLAACDESADAPPLGLSILRTRILDYLEANLHCPNLNARLIADKMGCSQRYIYRAFEGYDTTPERLIWNMRLARAKELVMIRHHGQHSLSEIAFACGFASYSHFSRAYKAKFGVSPRNSSLAGKKWVGVANAIQNADA